MSCEEASEDDESLKKHGCFEMEQTEQTLWVAYLYTGIRSKMRLENLMRMLEGHLHV